MKSIRRIYSVAVRLILPSSHCVCAGEDYAEVTAPFKAIILHVVLIDVLYADVFLLGEQMTADIYL